MSAQEHHHSHFLSHFFAKFRTRLSSKVQPTSGIATSTINLKEEDRPRRTWFNKMLAVFHHRKEAEEHTTKKTTKQRLSKLLHIGQKKSRKGKEPIVVTAEAIKQEESEPTEEEKQLAREKEWRETEKRISEEADRIERLNAEIRNSISDGDTTLAPSPTKQRWSIGFRAPGDPEVNPDLFPSRVPSPTTRLSTSSSAEYLSRRRFSGSSSIYTNGSKGPNGDDEFVPLPTTVIKKSLKLNTYIARESALGTDAALSPTSTHLDSATTLDSTGSRRTRGSLAWMDKLIAEANEENAARQSAAAVDKLSALMGTIAAEDLCAAQAVNEDTPSVKEEHETGLPLEPIVKAAPVVLKADPKSKFNPNQMIRLADGTYGTRVDKEGNVRMDYTYVHAYHAKLDEFEETVLPLGRAELEREW